MFVCSRLAQVWIWICSAFILVLPLAGTAQIIPDTTPGQTTNTQVQTNPDGDRHLIDQGITSGDGTNLFHHFSQFDLPTGNTAQFLLPENSLVENILNRVTGANPSEINGLLEIVGGNNPNLFLLNPSGILFGAEASLNIPGDLILSTATGLEFGEDIQWLLNSDPSDYADFNGFPTAFNFANTDGAIINAADLTLEPGQNLHFLGAAIANSGSIATTDGNLTLTAIPETGTIRLSQPGSLLSLEFIPDGNGGQVQAVDFAALLTGDHFDLDPDSLALGFSINGGLLQTDLGVVLPQAAGLIFSTNNLAANFGTLSLTGNQIGFGAGTYTGESLNLRATTAFFLDPDAALNVTEKAAIATGELGLYGDIQAGEISLDVTQGLEITSIFAADNWSLTANNLDIVAGAGEITLDTNEPFATPLTANQVGSDWLAASLVNRRGSLTTTNGDLNLAAPLDIDGIGTGFLRLNAVGDLVLDGAITDSENINNNSGDRLDLDFTSQGNLTVNAPILLNSGTLTFTAGNGTIFTNADISAGTLNFANNVETGDANFTATEGITWAGKLDGAANLKLQGKTLTFAEAVGSNTPLQNLTLIADNLTLNNNLFATGTLEISPLTANRSISLGGNDSGDRLTLGDNFFTKLQPGFRELSITGTNIELLNNLQLENDLTLQATDILQTNNFPLIAPDIKLISGSDLALGQITANNLQISSQGVITDTNPLKISGLLTLDTTAAIALDNPSNDFNEVRLINGDNVVLRDLNDITLTTAKTTGNFQIQATQIIAQNPINVDGALDFLTTNGINLQALNVGQNINLTSTNGTIQTGNITGNNLAIATQSDITTGTLQANQNISLTSNTGSIQTGNITGNNLAIATQSGITTGTLQTNQDISLTSNTGSIQTRDIAGNNVAIAAQSGITTGTLQTNQDISLTSNTGSIQTRNISGNNVAIAARSDLSTGNLQSNQGLKLTSATGAITSKNISAMGNVTMKALQNLTSGTIQADGTITLTSTKGAINTADIFGDRPVNLTAATDLTTGDITTQGSLTLTAGDTITTGNLTTASTLGNAGDIIVQAVQAIATGNINSSATTGNAGNVSLDPIADIETGYINAESVLGRGGNVEMTAGRYIRLTETFTAASGDQASISTIGGQESGEITLNHNGGRSQLFQVGNSTVNGSAGALVQGDITIPVGSQFPDTIDTATIKQVRPEDFPATSRSINAQQIGNFSVDFFRDTNVAELTATATELNNIEQRFVADYLQRFNLEQPSSRPTVAVGETLQTIQAQTDVVPAVVYAFFRPADARGETELSPQDAVEWRFRSQLMNQENVGGNRTDELELVLVKPNGDLIRKRIQGATREEVTFFANRFLSHVTNLRLRNAYFYSAQVMYDLLVRPIEAELEAAGVNNLTYIMDSGLRILPLAALHDGEQFLIEKYSVGIMPSFELTDTRYTDLRQSSVLAMGSAEFSDQAPLPAVPVELERVRSQIGQGNIFLNEQFTVENLLQTRRQTPYNIVHLATHGEFLPGSLANSYIQFWDERLDLTDLGRLQLDDPPVSLLVLSACRTALGNRDAELGFAGLAIASGAKSVLGSLWYVSDEGTLGLMTEFYRALKQKSTKAEALREAQLALLRGDVSFKKSTYSVPRGTTKPLPHIPPEVSVLRGQDFSHPYYWSAFNLVGNPW